jgi:hypothetical protein
MDQPDWKTVPMKFMSGFVVADLGQGRMMAFTIMNPENKQLATLRTRDANAPDNWRTGFDSFDWIDPLKSVAQAMADLDPRNPTPNPSDAQVLLDRLREMGLDL